jgi:hypothetical protein
MIQTIAAFIYITFVCWCYGSAFLHLVSKLIPDKDPFTPSFIITCFTGLAVVGTIFSALSLVMPLGTILSQLILLLPALYWAYKKWLSFRGSKTIPDLTTPQWAALFACILLVLVMHAWTVNHPDTLAYHAQNIQWIENYPAVPGIANLYMNYGIQSSWFVVAALFSFPFTGTAALTFINAVVLIWFIIFVIRRMNNLLWLILLAFCFWSYTQIRLTATSASPDFIAALYIWLIIYLFITRPYSTQMQVLLLFLSIFAITIKLSAIPCVLLSLYAWFVYGKGKFFTKAVIPCLVGILALAPFLARNVITSGYLFFPSSFPDLFAADWKISKETLDLTGKYITAYARTNAEFSATEIQEVIKMGLEEWLPVWWQLRSLPDKIILISIPVLLLLSLVFYASVFNRKNRPLITALIFCLIGIIFWFWQAPDPRFGFGFIISFCGMICYLLFGQKKIISGKEVLSFGSILLSVTILAYTAYRFSNHFTVYNIIQPSGIAPVEYRTIDCNGIPVNIPSLNNNCGNTPVPCATGDCRNFIPGGKNIRNGFISSDTSYHTRY